MQEAAQRGRLSVVKLSPYQVQQIRICLAKGWGEAEIAERFEVHRLTVRDIRKRRCWKHLPDETKGVRIPARPKAPLDHFFGESRDEEASA